MMRSCQRASGHTHRIELHQILLRFAECRAAVWCVPFFGAVGFSINYKRTQKKRASRAQRARGTLNRQQSNSPRITLARSHPHGTSVDPHSARKLGSQPYNPTLTRRASQHGHLCARRGVRGGVLGLWQGLSTLSPTLLVMTFYDNRQLSDKAPGRFLYFSYIREGLVEICHQDIVKR